MANGNNTAKRRLKPNSRVTVGDTARQRQHRAARREAGAKAAATRNRVTSSTTTSASTAAASPSSPSMPRFQLKLLNPCARHNTDIALPARPQAALLAPFYLRHWHVGLEHHLFTPEIMSMNAAWRLNYAKSAKRRTKRLSAGILTKLKWSSQNIVWPSERWLSEISHVVLGRHAALPSAHQLQHACVGRVHARLVCVDSALMHRFFTDCFPRVRITRDEAVLVDVVETRRRKKRGLVTAMAEAAVRAGCITSAETRGFHALAAPSLVTRSITTRSQKAAGKEAEEEEDVVVVVAADSATSAKAGRPDERESVDDSDEDEDDVDYNVAPFTTPYYCLVNYHDNLVYVNRTAVRCGRSVRLEDGDVISFLECAYGTDGGVLDSPMVSASAPRYETGATTTTTTVRAWSVPDESVLETAHELAGAESWVRLSLESKRTKVDRDSPASDEEEEDTADSCNLTTESAMVDGDRVVAVRRALDVPDALAHLLALWAHLQALLDEAPPDVQRPPVGAVDGVSEVVSGTSPIPTAPPATRKRSRSTSPTASTVPLNASASASSLRASWSRPPQLSSFLCASASATPTLSLRAPSIMTVVHNQLTLNEATTTTRDSLSSGTGLAARTSHGGWTQLSDSRRPFPHLPQTLRDWTETMEAPVLREVEGMLDALDGGAQDAVQSVLSPLAPALTLDAGVARRAFQQLTSTLTSASAAVGATAIASRQLFGTAHGRVKTEPTDEDEDESAAADAHAAARQQQHHQQQQQQREQMSPILAQTVKHEHKDGSEVARDHGAETSPLRLLVQQLTADNSGAVTTAAGNASDKSDVRPDPTASPGRLVWDETPAVDVHGNEDDTTWTGDDGAPQQPRRTLAELLKASPEAEGGGVKGEDGRDAADAAEDSLAPVAVAEDTAPFLRLVPAVLPVYVFTRRATSPERCLRETSHWRHRRRDGTASSGANAEAEPGPVYYYYDPQDDDENDTGADTDKASGGVRGVLKEVAGLEASTSSRAGGGGFAVSDDEVAVATPEEPVWVDESGRNKSSSSKRKRRRRRDD